MDASQYKAETGMYNLCMAVYGHQKLPDVLVQDNSHIPEDEQAQAILCCQSETSRAVHPATVTQEL